MELNLHVNATTTPKTRAYIQRSRRSVAELAVELGVSETTIRRWRDRTSVNDRSHTPKTLTTSLSGVEEALVCELRTRLQLPLDDVVEVMRRCVNAELSRSAIHRCLVRHGLNRRPKPDKPAIGVFEDATVGFIHIDLKHLPALERHKSYAFVAIDRATRYVYLEIHPKRDAKTAAGFLKRFLDHFPYPIHTILTDNGSEFTDRFAVDMKDKPHDRPSGRHPFDLVCAKHDIDHRLTRPYRPQTNGLVERFNRRIVDAIGQQPKRGIAHRLFSSHDDRDAFLNRFVHDYNRTRLKCLGYLAPLQALNNHPGPNTFAGHDADCKSKAARPTRLDRGDRLDLEKEIWIGEPAENAQRAGGRGLAEIIKQDAARLRHVMRIADVDRHFGDVGQFGASGSQRVLEVLHHQLGLCVEIVRRQHRAVHIAGDLARAEHQLFRALDRHHVGIV
jgi:transposase